MKPLFFAVPIWLALCSAAFAQQNCPATPAAGTNNTTCANTAFVQNQFASKNYVVGPGSATSGHVATFNGTSGALIQDGGTTVTSIATTYPISGGPITTTGTLTFVGEVASGRFSNVSTTSAKFVPYNGDLIKIAGVLYQIPSGGIAGLGNTASAFVNGVAAQAVAANTFYYVYAFNNSGTITADFSTTTHATDSTAGNVGVEIKNGDNSRTLIGAVLTDGSSHLQDTNGSLFTLSWFNRQPKKSRTTFSTGRSTASGSFVEINSEIRNSFIVWSDDAVRYSTSGAVSMAAAGSPLTTVGFDGATAELEVTSGTVGAGGQWSPAVVSSLKTGLSEGVSHFATVVGAVSTSTGTWFGGAISTANIPVMLVVSING